jgi:ferredoxin-type protein NapG
MSHDPQLSRRDLFRGRIFGDPPECESAAVRSESTKTPFAPSARYQKAFPILRPPGAIEEEAFLAGCTRCEACIQACPHGSITHAPLRFRRAAETPMIDPIQQPCWMCHDFPCIAACEPNVLRLDAPKKIGIALIDIVTCLPHQGSVCTVCSEQCPVPGAIELTAGRPRIVEDVCTGCGVCQFVCPAPHNAILLMPVPERRLPPLQKSDHAGPQ